MKRSLGFEVRYNYNLSYYYDCFLNKPKESWIQTNTPLAPVKYFWSSYLNVPDFK